MNLFFYDVDTKYVNYLKSIEIAKRGFTRVPDIEYQNEKKTYSKIKKGNTQNN